MNVTFPTNLTVHVHLHNDPATSSTLDRISTSLAEIKVALDGIKVFLTAPEIVLNAGKPKDKES